MSKTIVLLLCLCCSFATMLAQPVVKISSLILDESDIGSTVEIDVTVKDFTQIVSSQFSVNWNEEVLQFVEVTNFNTLGLSLDLNFSVEPSDVNIGQMRFLWYSGSGYGVTLPDDTKLFTIRYTIIGEFGEGSNISITGTPLAIEFADTSLMTIPDVILENGYVGIGVTSTKNISDQNITLQQNSPNPFSNITEIPFSLKSAENVTLSIYDITGQLIHTHAMYLAQGEHFFNVESTLLDKPGIYSYTVETSKSHFSKKMIFIQ